MDEERTRFVTEHIQAGKLYHDIRSELISHGYGTEGLEEAYPTILKSLGLKDERKKQLAENTLVAVAPVRTEGGEVPLPSIGGMIIYGLKLAKASLGSIFGATIFVALNSLLVVIIPNQPIFLLSGAMYAMLTVGLIFLSIVLSIIGSIALVYVLAHVEENIGYIQGLQWAFGRLGSVMWLSLMVTSIMLIGFVALIIPGLVFVVYSLFSLLVLARDGQGGMHAVVRSTDLVHGKFLPILGRVLILILISIPFAIVTSLLSVALVAVGKLFLYGELVMLVPIIFIQMFFSAFAIGAIISIYNARAASKPFFDGSAYNWIRLLYWVVFVIGILLPAGAAVAGFMALNSWFAQYQQDIQSQLRTDINQFSTTLDDGGEQVDTFIVERRVDTMFNAGQLHFNRILSYEGVCSDVLIEPPAECLNTNETFVIHAPIGQGRQYCRDNSGFKGEIAGSNISAFGCQ